MSYTDTWNEGVPSGGSPANTADDQIRALKLDFRERINSLMGVAIGTAFSDPIIATSGDLSNIPNLTPLLATQTYKKNITPASGMVSATVYDATLTNSADSLTINLAVVGGISIVWDLDLPVGVTIVSASICAASTVNPYNSAGFNFFRRPWGTSGSRTSLGSSSMALGTAKVITLNSAPLPYVTLDTESYALSFADSSTNATVLTIYGLQVVYTSPDANHRR